MVYHYNDNFIQWNWKWMMETFERWWNIWFKIVRWESSPILMLPEFDKLWNRKRTSSSKSWPPHFRYRFWQKLTIPATQMILIVNCSADISIFRGLMHNLSVISLNWESVICCNEKISELVHCPRVLLYLKGTQIKPTHIQ